jgi:Uma2 family endonuclease
VEKSDVVLMLRAHQNIGLLVFFWSNDMTLVKCHASRYTYSDYLTWPDNQTGELIDGAAYIREPPAPSIPHQRIVIEFCRQLATALKGKPYEVYIAPADVRLPKSGEEDGQIDTVVQPDVFIVCDSERVDARGLRGAPDWVAEVLSPSTASYDRLVKLPVYERAGVREVWLVHPIERTVAIYLLEAERYRQARIFDIKGKTPLTAVPGIVIDWEEVLVELG